MLKLIYNPKIRKLLNHGMPKRHISFALDDAIVYGDPDMSEETIQALQKLIKAARDYIENESEANNGKN